jgi:biotin carboxylase
VEYVVTIQHAGDLDHTIRQIQSAVKELGLTLLGCTPGCETGVELGDAISEALGLPGNGTKLSDMRRNKFLMQEQVRKAGVRAARQTKATSMPEVTAFLNKFGSGPLKLVIKPVASAGTDNVYVCRSKDEVRQRFKQIIGGTNILGKKNVEVVIQEFLEGKEYVIDTVSFGGVHKVVTIWEYDKRPENGADFVYFGLRLKSADEPRCRELIDYQKKVLDALEIKHGAGHGEVIYTPDGPCLVEVGARPHGGEGSWVPLVYKCLGTSQVKALVDVFLDPDAFDVTPDEPILKDFFGCEVDFVARETAILEALPRLDEIKKLKSFFEMDMFVKPGDKLVKTVDCITTPGNVRLCARDRAEMEADFARIRAMELEGFFVVKPLAESDKKAQPKEKDSARSSQAEADDPAEDGDEGDGDKAKLLS